MAKINLTDISSGYISTSTFNANNTLLEAAIEKTLSRDGTSPNAMEANLDMDSFRITNLVAAVNNTEPVILSQANTLAGVTNALTQNSVGAVLYPRTSAETSAGVTPTNFYIEPGNILRYGTNTNPGTTDMSTAWLNAFKSSERPYAPDGVYSINNTSEVDLDASNRRVLCEPGAIFDFTGNGMGFVLNGTNIHWTGGHLRGTGVVVTTSTDRNPSMLMVDGDAESVRRNIVIEKVKVTEANHSGIGVYRGTGVIIQDCVVEDDSGSSSVARFGLWANDCSHIDFTGNTIEGFGQCIGGGGNSGGYTWDGYDGETGSAIQRGILVSGNHMYAFGDHGVYFSDYQIALTVTNNYTYGGTSNPIKLQGDYIVCSNNVSRNAANGYTGRANKQSRFQGNTIEVTATGTAVYGIRIGPDDPFNVDIGDLIVSDNILKSTNSTGAGHGIEIDGISNSTDFDINRLIISNNVIEGYWCKLDTDPGGIYVRVGQLGSTAKNIDMCIIADNVIDLKQDHTNNNRGISLLFNTNHVRVSGNLVRGFVQHGIYADGANFISIDGNHLIGRAASTTNGIRTETDCTVIRIGSNVFEDCDTNVNSPEAVVPWRTPRVLEDSVAWDPGQIADHQEAVTEFTVTGAALGDPCIAGFSLDVTDLTLTACVTATDTVTVQLSNSTQGAIDLGNGNIFVRVFKKDG